MPGGWEGSDRSARLPSNWYTEIRPAILERDGYRCGIQWDDGCEVVANEVDHIKAGDDHRLSNLQAACSWCHARKSSAEGDQVRRRWSTRHTPERHPGLR